MRFDDPRERLPLEAKRFLVVIERHFGPGAARNVFVHHKPDSRTRAQRELGKPNSAAESEN
jgi:hypothetical protein